MLKRIALELIASGKAYIDYGQSDAIHNNPIIDKMYFETYSLQQVSNWKLGVLRLKAEPDNPVIYRRVDNQLQPTEYFIQTAEQWLT